MSGGCQGAGFTPLQRIDEREKLCFLVDMMPRMLAAVIENARNVIKYLAIDLLTLNGVFFV